MESEKGRSRASSTSSLGREVRCGCQFFQSDSLLPERRAMTMRPLSRNTNPVISSTCDHEYEPVGEGLLTRTMASGTAPVVKIIDTDIAPVADSVDGLDIRGRFTPGPVLEGDELILPLDGQIEDSAMEGRELGSGDTSDELETAQQIQDRIEERFLSVATPCTESRTDGEVNTSQVDSSVMEELPLRRGARGLPQRIRCQAGKLRIRLKSIQRPNFHFPIDRSKSPKSRSSDRSTKSSEKSRSKTIKKKKGKSKTSDKSKSSDPSVTQQVEEEPLKTEEKQSRIQKLRSSLPDRPKFSFPDRSKFHLPERPKINLPHLPKLPSRSSFRLPTLPRRRAPSLGSQPRQNSAESTAGSKKNIFHFSTIPRLFDRKSKQHHEYTTSSPVDSRAESSESTTLPRPKKTKSSFGARWTQKFTDIKFADDDETPTSIDQEKPWNHPSLEKPRLSLRPQESVEDSEPLPWEGSEGRRPSEQQEDLPYDEDSQTIEIQKKKIIPKRLKTMIRHQSSESYDQDMPQIDPRLYGDQGIGRHGSDDLESEELEERDDYRVSFKPVDPRRYGKRIPSEEDEEIEEDIIGGNEHLEENLSSEIEDESARSDREQQASSGSSCDRRRRGVIEEIDSDEFFLRAKGISQDDMHVGRFLASEIRDALRTPVNAQEIVILNPIPPARPARASSLRKRKESEESFEKIGLNGPKRISRRSEESDYGSNTAEQNESYSEPRHHRIVYHAESAPLDLSHEPLDDLIVIKPMRRKSRSSLRSSSLAPIGIIEEVSINISECPKPPPVVPRRRKRHLQQINGAQQNGICNGENHFGEIAVEDIRPKSEPPMKPARISSREGISMEKKMADIYNDMADAENEFAPIVPNRRSRSRGTSIAQDDDRTSRGAGSISDIAYMDDEDIENISRLDYPGYAIIEKRDKKPPRPPPPRRRKNKFATTPRNFPRSPFRPERAYSTLRPRSRSPSIEKSEKSIELYRASTPYLEIDFDEADQKDLLSGEVLSKMAGRPLPAPPRPPRSRREKMTDDQELIDEDHQDFSAATEAYASTQTDPLPDDLVIEEEILEAKHNITSSKDGSQIFASTERISSPHFRLSNDKIITSNKDSFQTSTKSEPDFRRSRESLDDFKTPEVPPLPIYHDEAPQRPPRTRSHSLSVPKELPRSSETQESRASMIEALEQRLSAILANETLKIGSLEVGDLRVDRLSVSTLEAHKIAASEIDAIVVSASEISNAAETEESVINPVLLRELIAIRSQLELVASQSHEVHFPRSESPSKVSDDISKTDNTVIEMKSWKETPKLDQLQLDSLSRTTESRAIFSTHGISSQQHPLVRDVVPENQKKEIIAIVPEISNEQLHDSQRENSMSRSRSSSPGKNTSSSRLRQTASPVRSLPPVISVTPDSPDVVCKKQETSEAKPQRAKISYMIAESSKEIQERSPSPPARPSSSQSRPTSPPLGIEGNQSSGQFIAFQTSQIPAQFFALAAPGQVPARIEEPSIVDMTQQLIRALRLVGKRAMRHFVGYVVSRAGREESEAKIREVELAFCALLLIVAGLLIVCFAGPRNITHHHHWDYFNPPRL